MSTSVVKGTIYVQPILSGELANIIDLEIIRKWIDSITHFSDARFILELVAADLDSRCEEKETVKANASYIGFNVESKMFTYECEFHVPKEFGEIGALLVENELHKERYIKKIVLDLGDCNLIFTCKSWVHPKRKNPSKRIFFTDKSYLPSETPSGLKSLREKDLESLRGNGEGTRKSFERIYDYDTYNDLGEPETASDLARPVLGGEKHPYPRRCRTGRDMTTKEAESRKKLEFCQFYVPRDEAFSDRKFATFGTIQALLSIMEAFRPSREAIRKRTGGSNSSLTESWFEKVVEYLVDKWADLNHLGQVIKHVVPKLLKDVYNNAQNVQHIYNAQSKQDEGEPHSWFRDEEFCRQTLAGINPYSIKLVTEWPLMSKLDPEVYGPPESAITKEIVEKEINRHNIQGSITFDEAFKQKKLFMLDYHDLLLPYVHTIRELEGTTLYGSRTLMYLTSNGTLTPVAIELTCPPNNGKPQWKHVYTPYSSYTDDTTTEACLWKLAKTHVLAHDSGYHQLISHWLRTHCATEPYIIATHRCLSKMHPIHGLLSPHLRYTMHINALARQSLINAGGIIESTFSPGKYSMQLSSAVYAQEWRFDREALPADLISRGMAVEDQSAKHGVRLTIEDYPFANDGLALWDAIKQWATSYINHYYPQPHLVESDEELQAWWTEIRTVGHGDKKDEPWWPQLKTQNDLTGVVTTIMWVASGHHSAVNFGQYIGGYLPYRPTIARTKMPNEDSTTKEWDAFVKNPEHALKNCFPSITQSIKVKSTLNLLSSHSPDEEYMGVNVEAAWEAEPTIKAAFHKFSDALNELEMDIDAWNKNPNLKNRVGAGKVPYPYELLKPKSEAGVTGKGVPYSISI